LLRGAVQIGAGVYVVDQLLGVDPAAQRMQTDGKLTGVVADHDSGTPQTVRGIAKLYQRLLIRTHEPSLAGRGT
jgi:hypothetical protein